MRKVKLVRLSGLGDAITSADLENMSLNWVGGPVSRIQVIEALKNHGGWAGAYDLRMFTGTIASFKMAQLMAKEGLIIQAETYDVGARRSFKSFRLKTRGV